MVRFIYLCMTILVVSFIAVPVFNGVSDEHARLQEIAQNTEQAEDSLSFEQIYALADESENDPANLNNIMPAAGGNAGTDGFSNGFRGADDSALADTPPIEPVIEDATKAIETL